MCACVRVLVCACARYTPGGSGAPAVTKEQLLAVAAVGHVDERRCGSGSVWIDTCQRATYERENVRLSRYSHVQLHVSIACDSTYY